MKSQLFNKSRPSGAQFCPFCGVQGRLQRDTTNTNYGNGIDFICGTCCAGFRLGISPRAQKALELLAEHRRVRDGAFNANIPNHIKKEWGRTWQGVVRRAEDE